MSINLKQILTSINKHSNIFTEFSEVYLFGSILDDSKIPNDIDILLIYEKYSENILNKIKQISYLIEKDCGLPVDLTVLSVEEEKEVKFLNRIINKCYKIKSSKDFNI